MDGQDLVVVGNDDIGNAYARTLHAGQWSHLKFANKKLLGLKPFSETLTVKILGKTVYNKDLKGMVILGDHGNMSISTSGQNIPIKIDDKTSFFDGSYGNFKAGDELSTNAVGIPNGVKVWMDVDVLGVGSQNAVRSRHVYQECTEKL